MIKFFRRIRKQLLSQNRFSKYMLYAIGEILLVVIGIIIALQVNNWNVNRINNNEAEDIIISIEEDLQKDILMLNQAIGDYETKLRFNNKLLDICLSENATIETFREVAIDFNAYYNPINYINNETMSSIQSTGNIELLNNEVKKELFEYQDIQENHFRSETANTMYYRSLLANYTAKYTFKGMREGGFIKQLNSDFVK